MQHMYILVPKSLVQPPVSLHQIFRHKFNLDVLDLQLHTQPCAEFKSRLLPGGRCLELRRVTFVWGSRFLLEILCVSFLVLVYCLCCGSAAVGTSSSVKLVRLCCSLPFEEGF